MEDPDKQPIDPDHRIAAPPPPRRKAARIIIWVLVLLVLLLVPFLFWRHHEKVEKAAAARPVAPGIPVTTATAKKGDIGVYLNAIGTVTPVYTDSITSQVTGLIVAVHYT